LPYGGIVGEFGVAVGEMIASLFGLFGYFLPLLLLYPIKRFFEGSNSGKFYEKAVAFTLLSFSILTVQALLIDNDLSGKIGFEIVLFFIPFIGLAGVWIFVFLTLIISLLIILEEQIPLIQQQIKQKTSETISTLIQKSKQRSKQEKQPQSNTLQTVDPTYNLHTKLDERNNTHANTNDAPIPLELNNEQNNLEYFDKNKQPQTFSTPKKTIEEKTIEEKTKQKQQAKKQRPTKQTKPAPADEIHIEEVKRVDQKEFIDTLDTTDLIDTIDTINQTKQSQTSNTKLKEPQNSETLQTTPKEDRQETVITPPPPKPKQPEKPSVIVEELEENKKLLEEIDTGDVEKPKDFILPSTTIFAKPSASTNKMSEDEIDSKIADLLEKLAMFKVEGDVVRTYSGPVVTTFEFKPAPNVKVSKILNLQDDLAMALKATTIRIQAPIPGKDVVGIEVPNNEMDTIYFREILESDLFKNASSPLTMILGKDIVGQPFITDLKKLPHLLIAGTTGSGKSVGLNGMILSLLFKNSPDNLKLIMIDPKMLEFSIYNDIPHLLTPVITKATEAINALGNMVGEMERRYTLMSQTKTKNIENYNTKSKKEGYEPFPYIVIIIDELADLMMTSGKDVEYSIARLAQMARASGIHLIVATQRPSVDVVTGLIKANLPSRLSYKVGQRVDSKIILDSLGAESLLGRGDMLFTPPGSSSIVRIHAPWSTEEEIEEVVEYLKSQREADYDTNFLISSEEKALSAAGESGGGIGDLDELYEEAKSVVLNDKKSSISYIQRKLRIGYNRAASIVEQLEQTGVLSAPNAKGIREILI
jgi:S-DNA-T family DNA segregation ATPase FtsK/SpoIIIE